MTSQLQLEDAIRNDGERYLNVVPWKRPWGQGVRNG